MIEGECPSCHHLWIWHGGKEGCITGPGGFVCPCSRKKDEA